MTAQVIENQVEHQQRAIQGLLAQLDAHRQQMNDYSNIGIQLRTNFILLEQKNKELNEKIHLQEEKIKSLTSKLEEVNRENNPNELKAVK